ncbi:MAG: xanthine dehydrogenase family protein molybdopterin-binding subunit [Kiritimatiellae bacterium]|nr:xanthine dehydrogenase family protein molybdopterin-binding subunit [Kiritimatiellia bacterium]
MEFKYIGKDILRPDATAKITGKAKFLADLKLPGMLHCAILRPTVAHAKIVSIDTSEAEQCPGVVKVVTAQGQNYRYGDNIRDFTPMAGDRVRHIGEAVAAVIADSAHHAREAVKKIKPVYEPLPVYVDARDALKPDAVLIHPDSGDFWHLPGLGPKAGTNIANYYKLVKGDVKQGFADAEVTVEGEFNYPFGSCSAIEPHGAIAWFHEDGLIEIWSSSICPFVIRDEVARVYNRPISEVRVHIPELGGCFGYKSDITVEQTIAFIASFVPGRPVKWVATRKEDLISTLMGHGIRTKMKLGAKKDGTLTAIQATLYHSTGAYADTGIHVCIGATHNCTGPYEFPNCFMESFLTYTNTPPIGAFRGYGHQEGQFGVERLMDMLARKLKMSPFALREKNYLGEGKTTSLGEKLWKTNGDVRACVEHVKKAVFEKPKPKEDEQFYYGRGFVAVMKSPKGAPFSSKGCYLKMNPDGSVCINMGGAEVGQGLRNVVRLVAAEALKIPPERIRVYTEIDTQFSPWEWQTIGSMFTTQGGRAVVRAAEKAIAVLKRTAGQVLKCDEDMLDYDGEFVFLKSDPGIRVEVPRLIHGYITGDGITIGEVVQTTADCRLPRYSGLDPETGQGSAGVEYTFGAQACDLRIEKATGKVLIDHFASSFDVGRVIQPKQIRGQIVGGVMIAIGSTLHEELKFDKDGKCLNPFFGRYRFPTIKDRPAKQTVVCVETPAVVGPFGARGIGEHPLVGVAPCILNAIQDAIGVEFTELPVTPDKVKKALEAKAAGGKA